jgi:hypothetical protein
MSKSVKGFLAEDGTFFDTKPECQRYEHSKHISILCESHGINYDNFLATLNAWHKQIRGYYDANDACKEKWTKQDHNLNFNSTQAGDDEHDYDAFLRTEDDRTDAPVGDKESPGFLEQQIRGYK